MNNPYKSIALELYTKIPYEEITCDIWKTIIQQVKIKEKHIYKKINKRSYYNYKIYKIFYKWFVLSKYKGPKNMFNYSQSRQTNERFRTDISYSLIYPQKPLLITQNMNYLDPINIHASENCVATIADYRYNQEDALIYNKSVIQPGLFVSSIMKKYVYTIIKNPILKGTPYISNIGKSEVLQLSYKRNLNNMNNPYKSIALELYTKIPYEEITCDIWKTIIQQVKIKEKHIYKKINKRSYYNYKIYKIFITWKEQTCLYALDLVYSRSASNGLLHYTEYNEEDAWVFEQSKVQR